MTAKEKAIELVERMNDIAGGGIYDAKQYALLTIEEILLEVNSLGEEFTLRLDGTRQYWDEVKQEIEKI